MDLFNFITGLEPLIRNYSILFTFISSLFLGEEIVLILSFLSANGYLSLWIVFVFCFAGRVISDFFFFTLGKLRMGKFLVKYQENIFYKDVDKIFSKLNRKNTFVTLLYIKFLFGIRALMMFYIGYKGVSLKKVLISDIGAVFVWLLILIPIGWFAGSSFRIILNFFGDFRFAFLFLFVLIILGFFIRSYVHQRLLNKRAQLLS